MEEIVLTIGGLIKSFDWSDFLLLLIGLILVILLIYIIYLIGREDEVNNKQTDYKLQNDKNDIKSIIENLEANYEAKPIDLSEYEQEMENTAIISYDELLEKTSTNITYDDEYVSNIKDKDIVVKKVDPTNTSLTKEMVDLPKAIMMNYESEEAFLKALKKLQKNLVR